MNLARSTFYDEPKGQAVGDAGSCIEETGFLGLGEFMDRAGNLSREQGILGFQDSRISSLGRPMLREERTNWGDFAIEPVSNAKFPASREFSREFIKK
jgi:hypothetical protein